MITYIFSYNKSKYDDYMNNKKVGNKNDKYSTMYAL